MTTQLNPLYEKPAYGVVEAAIYLKVPVTTLRYWLTGFGKRDPIIAPVETALARRSFMNLLECQALAGMRKTYDLKLPKVRKALRKVSEQSPKPHPVGNHGVVT